VCDCVSVWIAVSDVSNGCVTTGTITTEWGQRNVSYVMIVCICVCAQLPGCCLLFSVLGELVSVSFLQWTLLRLWTFDYLQQLAPHPVLLSVFILYIVFILLLQMHFFCLLWANSRN